MNKELVEGFLDVVKDSIREYQSAGDPPPGDRRIQREVLETLLELNERMKRIERHLFKC